MATSCLSHYISLPQDTCASIATFYGITTEQLALDNPDLPCTEGNANLKWCINAAPKDFCGEENTRRVIKLGDTCESVADSVGWSLEEFHARNPELPCAESLKSLYGSGFTTVCIPTVEPSSCDSYILNNRDFDYCFTGDAEQYLEEVTTCDQLFSQFSSEFYITGREQHCCDQPLAAGTRVCAPSAHGCDHFHTTGLGETCESIADLHRIEDDQLEYDNPSLDCSAPLPGNVKVCIAPPHEEEEEEEIEEPFLVARGDADCKRTYSALQGDTCALIGYWHGMTAQQVKAANDFLNCDDIWAFTPICITTDKSKDPKPACTSQLTTTKKETCATIANRKGMNAIDVWALNRFVGCDDIWSGTQLCLVGESQPSCAFTYSSLAGENCATIENKFRLSSGDLAAANPTVNCNDIWAYTPLCIPPAGCQCEYWWTAPRKMTCEEVGNQFKVGAQAIQTWNPSFNCNDIWQGTSICVSS